MPLGVQSGYLDSGSEKASTRSALSGAEARIRWRTGQSLMSMTGVGNVAEPRNNTRGAFSNTPTLWNQDWSGWLDSDQRTLASKARALSRLSYTHDDDSLEREARQ